MTEDRICVLVKRRLNRKKEFAENRGFRSMTLTSKVPTTSIREIRGPPSLS